MRKKNVEHTGWIWGFRQVTKHPKPVKFWIWIYAVLSGINPIWLQKQAEPNAVLNLCIISETPINEEGWFSQFAYFIFYQLLHENTKEESAQRCVSQD